MTHQTMCPTHRPRIFAKAKEPQQASAGRSWYRIEAKAGEDGKPSSVEVLIYDEIGLWGISAARFVEDLKAVDDGAVKVTVAINSPGGDVFDGFAIHNTLVRLGDRCTVRIDGLAASAWLALQGLTVAIIKNRNPPTRKTGYIFEIILFISRYLPSLLRKAVVRLLLFKYLAAICRMSAAVTLSILSR